MVGTPLARTTAVVALLALAFASATTTIADDTHITAATSSMPLTLTTLATSTRVAAATTKTTSVFDDPEPDKCLTRKFLAVAHCDRLSKDLATIPGLLAAGWHCCWSMPLPLEGNPFVS